MLYWGHILAFSIRRFWENRRGNLAVTLAVLAIPLTTAAGVAVDYTIMSQKQRELQQAADAAALASVRELSLSGANIKVLQSLAESYVHSNLWGTGSASVDGITVRTSIPKVKSRQVTVDIDYVWRPFLIHYVTSKALPLKASATATLSGASLTCVIGLMQPQIFAKASVHLDNKSVIKAGNCSVFSNSVSKFGLRADDNAEMSAQTICSAGGVITFGKATFDPLPISDCPKIEDPLRKRKPPAYGGCTETALTISKDTLLSPGVYCNGLTISGNAQVNLKPGIYVIKDGPLIVDDKAGFSGTNVSFFLTGDNSIFEFRENTTIDLSAMDSGPTAGLLFFEDQKVVHSFNFNPFALDKLPPDVRLHRIASNDARNLLGTLYLSRSILLIDANAPVADASAYTAIVTGRLWLREGPILTLNADYTTTTVPVPEGLAGTQPKLIH